MYIWAYGYESDGFLKGGEFPYYPIYYIIYIYTDIQEVGSIFLKVTVSVIVKKVHINMFLILTVYRATAV